MDEAFATKYAVPLCPVDPPMLVETIDGRVLLSGPIKVATQPLRLVIGAHEEAIQFYVTSGLHFPMVLGLAWLQAHDPQIYWSQNLVTFPALQCEDHTHHVCAGQLLSPPRVSLSSDIADFADVFSEQEADQLPPHRPYDCPIDLIPDALLAVGYLYSMSDPQLAALRDFLDKNLDRGFIRPSSSPLSAPVLFVKKKTGDLRLWSWASFKESYMATFYDYFNEQKYADAVKNFLDLISSSGRRDHKIIEQPILLKEGFMIKRAQGRKRFGMKNFKKRWFRLSNHEFTYQKNKGDHPLCSIPIENILAVEKLEEESFKMKNMFQVIQPERVLYIQANNCVEAKDWIDILTKVSQCNKKRLTVYHPSAYLNGHWLCCKSIADNAPGCTPCTGGLPANIQLDIDGDRESERIYSLFNLYMTKLEKMQEACGSRSVYDGPEQEEYSTFVIDDPQETYKTLKQIIANIKTLEQEHAQYKRDKFKKTKYGSQEHPIGDKSFQSYIRQ
ncbi:PREDICTED: ras GTPase-activating protein 3-like [Thamnophis sirtalis]|uniref:Ras GTPase-activating protein 3-like n=1 Tax=Thamnophis sirtalis TaxID=35019 RepID=A0A6I9X262_9SAUR|nr:PREDICTED: ras GTPase-activating protein 3-like [Thamnophis sirtalis]